MTRKSRSVYWLALLALLSLALVACGGDGDTGTDDGGDSGSSGEEVTISYSLWDANQLPAYEQCATDFMAANPNINVEIEQLGWDDYWNNIQTGMVSGSAPDTFTNHLAKFPEFASKDQLVDIEPFVQQDDVDTSIYIGELANLWTRDGQRYGLPKDWDTIAVIYNKDALAEAGISEEELNSATWDPQTGGTFENIAARLTIDENGNNALSPDFDADNVDRYGLAVDYGGAGAYGQTQWSSFAVSNGWQFNDGLYDTKYNYEDSKLIETIDWYAGLATEKNIAAPFEDVTSLGANTLFTSGDAALTTDGSWMIGFYSDNSPFDIGFARLPIGPEGRKSMFNGLADSIWVGTEHVDQSWEWVKYLASPACESTVGTYGVVFPATEEGVQNALNAYAERGLDVTAFTDQALEENGTFLFPVTDNASEVSSIMDETMDSIFLGDVKAADALPAADEEVDALFNQ